MLLKGSLPSAYSRFAVIVKWLKLPPARPSTSSYARFRQSYSLSLFALKRFQSFMLSTDGVQRPGTPGAGDLRRRRSEENTFCLLQHHATGERGCTADGWRLVSPVNMP